MIRGKYFQIPERPADVDHLRRMSDKLCGGTCPDWLNETDLDFYRYIGHRILPQNVAQQDEFRAEVEQLELAGLIVSVDRNKATIHHIYIPSRSEYDEWSIGIYRGHSLLDLKPANGISDPILTRDDVSDVAATFVADPFMVQHQGVWFMFFELLNWRANKGEIGLATSTNGEKWSYQGRVLVEPHHLSYPHVLRHEGEYFMIPETRQGRQVRLYRASDFPSQWTLDAVLLDEADLVDSTLFQSNGRWWMLAGNPGDGACKDLKMFVAERLSGPWTEHPASPVIRNNSQSARPAGRVVWDGCQWVRFAQNCDQVYGLDVRAFRICDLTFETYQERPLRDSPILRPGSMPWNSGGMHHIDAHLLNDGTWLTCVDGWRSAGDAFS